MRRTFGCWCLTLAVGSAAACDDGTGPETRGRIAITPDSTRAILNSGVVFRATIIDAGGAVVGEAPASAFSISDTTLASLRAATIGPGVVVTTRRPGLVTVTVATTLSGQQLEARAKLVIENLTLGSGISLP